MTSQGESVQREAAGWVALVGAGPGDEGLLTVRGAELLASASLVVAGPDLAGLARRYMTPQARLADPADGDVAGLLTGAVADGELAVRLYYGDPLLNGAAQDATACACLLYTSPSPRD